jgi:electron transport complex protein RnfB
MKEEVYRKLQRHIDKMPIPYPATKSGVELKLLKHLFTPSEAELALNISALIEPAEKIHGRIKKNTLPLAEVEEMLDRLVRKGAIRRRTNRAGIKKYGKLPLAIGMFEAQVNQITKEYADDFYAYEKEGFADAVLSTKTNQMRTIPVNIKIEPEYKVSNYDDITKIIENSPGPFAVMNCVCRQARDAQGNSCKQTDIRETCILLERSVEFATNLDAGRIISKKEVFKILTQAKKAGLVLEPENTQHPNFICCCCGCCCGVLTAAKHYDKPAEFLHSNFYAEVKEAECDGCWKCVDRCQMDAIDKKNATDQDTSYAAINLDRCIGCGLCIPTCKPKAVKLIKKDVETSPPENDKEMYKKIMFERFGVIGTLKIAGKAMLGMKI